MSYATGISSLLIFPASDWNLLLNWFLNNHMQQYSVSDTAAFIASDFCH